MNRKAATIWMTVSRISTLYNLNKQDISKYIRSNLEALKGKVYWCSWVNQYMVHTKYVNMIVDKFKEHNNSKNS